MNKFYGWYFSFFDEKNHVWLILCGFAERLPYYIRYSQRNHTMCSVFSFIWRNFESFFLYTKSICSNFEKKIGTLHWTTVEKYETLEILIQFGNDYHAQAKLIRTQHLIHHNSSYRIFFVTKLCLLKKFYLYLDSTEFFFLSTPVSLENCSILDKELRLFAWDLIHIWKNATHKKSCVRPKIFWWLKILAEITSINNCSCKIDFQWTKLAFAQSLMV